MISLFVSYCHADQGYRTELEKHLSLLKREGLIQVWHDRQIEPGEVFDKSISDKLEQANIILLLISSDFISSEYCWGVEVKRAMEKHQDGTARVVPIILRACDWNGASFGKLLALPEDGKPIGLSHDRDAAYLEVARGIRRVAGTLSKGPDPAVKVAEPPKSAPPSSLSASKLARVICHRCGKQAGSSGSCLGTQSHHEFKSFPHAFVFCHRCGKQAGSSGSCLGTQSHHEFMGYESSNVICARCGKHAGSSGSCLGTQSHHDYRQF